jgi:protein-L-isoaspartate(D-aspartate) O-methyltransferase
MLETIRAHGASDPAVLAALERVPRHLFLPGAAEGSDPYGDHPCEIGWGQTISQPFIVAYMIERLELPPAARVLEIGSGSGYAAAVLAELGAEVYAIERVTALAERARDTFGRLGCRDVLLRNGDGSAGWPEHAPYDGILISCAPARLPERLVAQLRDGGRMVVPVGEALQRIYIVRRDGDAASVTEDLPVRFVPMVSGGDA